MLSRRTEGNPFFLIEYARLLHDEGSLDAVPAAVSDVLGRRLAGQPEDTMTALRAAAVLGREVPLPTLAAVLDRDDDAVLDLLDPALAAGLLVEDGVDRFRFSHALIRDAVYATLPVSRAARLHARAAEAWEQRAGDPHAVGETARERHGEQRPDPQHEQREPELADLDSDVRGDPRDPGDEAPDDAPVNREDKRGCAAGATNVGDGYCE